MSFVTSGLPNGGRTAHFRIAHDEASCVDGRNFAIALLGMCEDDYDLRSRWFRGVELSINPVSVRVSTSASRNDVSQSSGRTVFLAPNPSPGRIRYLFVAEVSKLFMRAQNRGWLDAEGRGHGLSLARFLGAQALAANALGAPELDLQPATQPTVSRRVHRAG
jgi:hypothetical protein